MKQYFKAIFLGVIFSFLILPNLLQAQSIGGDTPTDPDIPIDGGVGILVAAGIAYGAKKIREERKKKANKSL